MLKTITSMVSSSTLAPTIASPSGILSDSVNNGLEGASKDHNAQDEALGVD
jgi:hypothetical protein